MNDNYANKRMMIKAILLVLVFFLTGCGPSIHKISEDHYQIIDNRYVGRTYFDVPEIEKTKLLVKTESYEIVKRLVHKNRYHNFKILQEHIKITPQLDIEYKSQHGTASRFNPDSLQYESYDLRINTPIAVYNDYIHYNLEVKLY